MTTAAQRLKELSGSGLTAGQRLRAIGGATALTAGALLVSYSGLPSGTAAEHLLATRAIEQPAPSGASTYGGRYIVSPRRDAGDVARLDKASIEHQNDVLLMIAATLIKSGILD